MPILQTLRRAEKGHLYQFAKDRLLSADKYVGFGDSEIEDLFPPEFPADVIQSGKPIVPQIDS
jgi:hypothetical protein